LPEKFARIEQENWDTPDCADWIGNIEKAVRRHETERVVLIAHSLGCAAIAHWTRKFRTPIKGAFLVAPSDCEATTYTFETTGFSPVPLERLPFKSLVVASTNDYYVTLERAAFFAESWGSEFVNIGAKDHINADAGFGEWREGLELLKKLD
jgi:predicted alpha/beta hydrolase family esterase